MSMWIREYLYFSSKQGMIYLLGVSVCMSSSLCPYQTRFVKKPSWQVSAVENALPPNEKPKALRQKRNNLINTNVKKKGKKADYIKKLAQLLSVTPAGCWISSKSDILSFKPQSTITVIGASALMWHYGPMVMQCVSSKMLLRHTKYCLSELTD